MKKRKIKEPEYTAEHALTAGFVVVLGMSLATEEEEATTKKLVALTIRWMKNMGYEFKAVEQ